jgi:hypothetical protein
MKFAIRAMAFATFIVCCVGSHVDEAGAEPFNLTKATSGYLYFNRPDADMAQHDGELKNCIANWKAEPQTDSASSSSRNSDPYLGPVGQEVLDTMISGWEAARQNINIEHCMVAKGWRLVRLSEDEGQRLSLLPQRDLVATLQPYIAADLPPGEIVRIWRNEELYSDTIIVSSPRNATRQMLSIAVLSPDNPTEAGIQSTDIKNMIDIVGPWNESLKRNQPKPFDQAAKPGPGQALLIYTLRMPKKTKRS